MSLLSNLEYPFRQMWYKQQNIAVIGWAFDEKYEYFEKDDLGKFFENVGNEEDFKTLLCRFNGNFAVVIEQQNFTALAVDHIRSIPLIYRETNDSIELLNSFEWRIDMQLNENGVDAFKNCWCTLDNETLVAGVDQLQAGQYLWKPNHELASPKFYFQHFKTQKLSLPDVEQSVQLFKSTFHSYFDQLKGRTALIPLSGGYDSRLILSLLYQYGYSDIIAYTYGKKHSHEVQIAQKVCETLRIKWHFVEYDKALFQSFFTEEWETYSNQNHFFSSLPHEQDFFALAYLRSKNLLPDNFVAIPGFSGDLLGGSITGFSHEKFDSNHLIHWIKEKHLQNADIKYDSAYLENINSRDQFYDQYQNWFVINKVTKFIVNAVRLYEYFGGDWLMPFWDKNLIDYWYQVPYPLRMQQQFYNEVIFQKFFTPLGVDAVKPGYDDNYPNPTKERIKRNLPSGIKNMIKLVKKSISVNDVNNLNVLNDIIQDKIKGNKNYSDQINNTHAIYFLQNLNKSIH